MTTRVEQFTAEGVREDVYAAAEYFGWKITRRPWWQRTYAIPRWLVWMVGTSMTLTGLHAIVGWLGG